MAIIKILKTCKQSYEMYFPNSTNKFIGYEEAPPVPVEAGVKFCKLSKRIFNPRIYWTHDKTQINYDDGRVLIYWRKPTMKMALERISDGCSGEYFRFHKDGSVEHGMNGEYYRWGPDIEVEYDVSYVQETCEDCLNKWDYENNPELYYDDYPSYSDLDDDYYDHEYEIGPWYY